MAYQVQIQDTPYLFLVEENESILRAALRQNIPLPYSCSSEVCGVCMSRVISGEVFYPHGAPLALCDTDLQAGYALFCTGYARSDLILAIPELVVV